MATYMTTDLREKLRGVGWLDNSNIPAGTLMIPST